MVPLQPGCAMRLSEQAKRHGLHASLHFLHSGPMRATPLTRIRWHFLHTLPVWNAARLLIGAICLAAVSGDAQQPAGTTQPTSQLNSSGIQAYGKLPISFEPNVGQKAPQVSFVAHGRGYDLFLAQGEAVLVLCPFETAAASPSRLHPEDFARRRSRNSTTTCSTLHLRFSGANSAANIVAMNELPGKSNYFIGNDPAKWRTGVPTYAQVKYEQIYSGVDLMFYGDQRRLEYDFRVAPQADPNQIVFSFDGASSMRADAEGHLRMGVEGGEVRLKKPVIYQESNGVRREISGRYRPVGPNTVRIDIGPYDHTKTLVVDPLVDYSTYLGGSSSQIGTGMAVDSSGDAFVAGLTSSTDFPKTANAVGGTNKSTYLGTAYVTEINPAGTAVLYSTYIGGTGGDDALRIALDSASPPSVYITGWTCSKDFPTTSNAYMPTFTPPACGSGNTAFVTKFNPSLSGSSALQYSTYLSGSSGSTEGYDLAVDKAGNIYVTGDATSSNFPTTAGAFQSVNHGSSTGFVTRIDPTKSGAASLIYSTYLGGSGSLGDIGSAIAVDSSQNAYVAGFTSSVDFPTTASAFMRTAPSATGSSGTAFVARINTASSGSSSLVYSTFLGAGGDAAGAVALGPNNLAYIIGGTTSANFPVTAGAYRTTAPAAVATYGAEFFSLMDTSKSGTASLVYSTFFGGSSGDSAEGVAADSVGNAYIVGFTVSTDFPVTTGAYQTSLTGCGSGFVSELMPAGNGSADLVYSTYFDGTETSTFCAAHFRFGALGLALDSANNVYITGQTGATNFPVTPSNAYQTSLKGTADSFVAKLTLTPKVVTAPSITGVSPSSGLTGTSVTITGKSFGANQELRAVTFNGTAATPTSWAPTTIAVPVPIAATTGNVVVTVLGVASNAVGFTVSPDVTSLSPTSGVPGASVTIAGTGFGLTRGTSTVSFHGTSATPTSWSDTSIVVPVPSGATTGNVVVTVNGVNANGVSFTVLPTPSISSVSPSSAAVGASVTIAGVNFGSSQGSGTVKFNGTAATVTSWTASSIVATVPSGATTGNVVVYASGVNTNGVSFTVLPGITGLNPSWGAVGTPVTITGTSFGSTQGTSTVTFNGVAATVTSWSSSSIVTTVPSGATTGNVVVTVSGLASKGATFTLGPAVFYYVEDSLGTSRVMTTRTGVVCYDADFAPYGQEFAYVNSCTQNVYKFEGKERDTETGNDDFGARYYSNRMGRWLSADWSAVPVAVPYANLTNPQTLNLYTMVADDPESFADLDGHDGGVTVVTAIETASVGGPVTISVAIAGIAITAASEIIRDHYDAQKEATFREIGAENQQKLQAQQQQQQQANAEQSNAEQEKEATPDSSGAGARKGGNGTIYKVPGSGTQSGKPYIGRHNKPDPSKTRRSKDGRDRKQAKVVDTYNASDTQEGRKKEQNQIDLNGGVQNLDNKRNEIKRPPNQNQ